jgi:hypothetical protein
LIATVAAAAVIVMALIAWQMRQQSKDCVCGENLEYIGIAIRNYHESFGVFPSPDAGGHSWRIRIVPFLFASAMYDEYRWDEPWNSESNRTLDSRPLPVKDEGPDRPHGMPYPYECPLDADAGSKTSFLMFVGDNAFGKPGGFRQLDEITDPLEVTLVAAETSSRTVHWLEPKDFDTKSMSFSINDSRTPSISSTCPRGPAVLFADGAVFRMSPDLDPELVRAMATINGGEDLRREELLDRNLLRPF